MFFCALLLPVQGTLLARGSSVSRAQFLVDLAGVLDQRQLYPPGPPTFADVPASSPLYGYVEAAVADGWLPTSGGMLHPNAPATWGWVCQVAMRAVFGEKIAGGPACLARAKAVGLLAGLAPGRSAEAVSLAEEGPLLVAVHRAGASMAPAVLRLTVSTSWARVGQPVQLHVTAFSGTKAPVPAPPVVYSVAGSGARVMGSTFVAAKPGVFTVTAAAANGVTDEAQITVYGPVQSLRVLSLPHLIADGVDTGQVAVVLVDAGGRRVYDATDMLVLQYAVRRGATRALLTARTHAVNGVATFRIQAGIRPNVADVLVVRDASRPVSPLRFPIMAHAQELRSFAIAAPAYVVSTSPLPADITVRGLDQLGQPLLQGHVEFTASLSGPATFADGHAVDDFAYDATPSTTSLSLTILPVLGQGGTIRLTVEGPGGAMAQAEFDAVVPGPPVALQVLPPPVTTISQTALEAGPGLTFGIRVVDEHGYVVPVAKDVVVSLQRSDRRASHIELNGQAASQTLVHLVDGEGSVVLSDRTTAPDAGAYTLLVADPTDELSPPLPSPLRVTPGPATGVEAHLESTYVPSANPLTAVDVQLTDRYGNPVAQPGVDVYVQPAPHNPRAIAVVSPHLRTDRRGQARALVLAPPFAGVTYGVDVNLRSASRSAETILLEFTVEPLVAASVDIDVADANAQATHAAAINRAASGSVMTVASGDALAIVFHVEDERGQLVSSNDVLLVRTVGPGTLTNVEGAQEVAPGRWVVNTVHGNAVVTATAAVAGKVTLLAKDTSVSQAPTGLASLNVVPGPPATFAFTGPGLARGTVTVEAGKPTPVELDVLDGAGNPTTFTQPTAVDLRDANGGQFRLNETGAAVSQVILQPGQSTVDLYFVASEGGTYDLTGDAALQVPSTIAGSLDGQKLFLSPGQAVVITYTVLDQEGQPVPFQPIGVLLSQPTASPAEGLGRIEVPGPLVTNQAGQVAVTYVAGGGSADLGCQTLTAVVMQVKSGTVTLCPKGP
jgi:hypothetical protein